MKVKKKKTLAQKIAEKEAAAEEARLEALAAEEEDTPEARWLIYDCHLLLQTVPHNSKINC